jgi:hypothetical protein
MAKRKSQAETDAADQDQVDTAPTEVATVETDAVEAVIRTGPEAPDPEPVNTEEEQADRDIDGLRKALEPGQVLVQFTMDVVVEDEHQGTASETRYAGGAIEALSEGSAQHFINRGKAVAV